MGRNPPKLELALADTRGRGGSHGSGCQQYRERARSNHHAILWCGFGQHRTLKNIFGGELRGYTELLRESRDDALERMLEEARSLGANAVVNVRFSTSSVAQGAAELFAYGTAVQVE
jgi:hypothetical protein